MSACTDIVVARYSMMLHRYCGADQEQRQMVLSELGELSGPEHELIVLSSNKVQLQVICTLLQGLLQRPSTTSQAVDAQPGSFRTAGLQRIQTWQQPIAYLI